MTKLEFIEKYGEEAYNRHVNRVKKWNKDHPIKNSAHVKKWQIVHADKCREKGLKWSRNNKTMFAFCISEETEEIENYKVAKENDFKGWCIHHRLETHNSDGEKRIVNLTVKELKELGMYFNRPAKELIFLTRSEHSKLHKQNN